MPDTQPWLLRYIEEGDEQGLLDLLNAAFGRWPRFEIDADPIDHLRWKLRLEDGDRARSYVAVAGGRIIGCAIGRLHAIKVNADELPAMFFFEWAVHPDYQGQGVMRDMWTFKGGRSTGRSYRVSLSATSNEAVQHKTETAGWSRGFANSVEELKARVSPEGGPPPGGHPWQIHDLDRFDDRAEAFWNDASKPYAFMVMRGKDHLNWRYGDKRAGRYSVRVADEGGPILGYCVVAQSGGRSTIADLLALPGRSDVIDSLLADALRRAAADGMDQVRCWSPRRHPYREVLHARGFRFRRELIGLNFGSPEADLDLAFRADPDAAIHLTPGDTDLV